MNNCLNNNLNINLNYINMKREQKALNAKLQKNFEFMITNKLTQKSTYNNK